MLSRAYLSRLIKPIVPDRLTGIAKRVLGQKLYRRIKKSLFGADPGDQLGVLRRVEPIYSDQGWSRGQPIVRFYTERRFFPQHASDIHGHVLEIGESTYTRRFGRERVLRSDVLHVTPGHPGATIIADLTSADHLPPDTYDCIIITFTLQFIYDVRAAIRTLHRILKPRGVVLATFTGVHQISRYDMDTWGEYWRVTELSAHRLFSESFPQDSVTVKTYGNALAAVACLHGFIAKDFTEEELDYHHQDYDVLITVRAVRNHEPRRP